MNGRHRRVKRLLFFGAAQACTFVARTLPRPAALSTFSAIGGAAGVVDRPARRRALQNLDVAFGQTFDEATREEIARAMFRDLGRNLVDLLRMDRLSPETLRRLVVFEGLENLDEALARRRGVLAVSAHFGNWELLGAALCARGYPLHVVARPLFDTNADRLLTNWRRNAGIVVHSRQGGLRGAAQALRAGEIVGVLMDQDTHGPGIFVDFFGRPAHTPRAPFALARRRDAAIVPIVIALDDDGVHRARVYPEIPRSPAADETERLGEELSAWHRVLEGEITRRPTQWPWFHRRWKKVPETMGHPRIVPAPRPMRNIDLSPSRPAAISR